MVIELEEPICFEDDTKIDAVGLKVPRKWIGSHVIVTGSMEGGLMWFINVFEIVVERADKEWKRFWDETATLREIVEFGDPDEADNDSCSFQYSL